MPLFHDVSARHKISIRENSSHSKYRMQTAVSLRYIWIYVYFVPKLCIEVFDFIMLIMEIVKGKKYK